MKSGCYVIHDASTLLDVASSMRCGNYPRAFCAKETEQLTPCGSVSTVCTASLRKSAEPAYWPRPAPVLGQRARAPGDEATVPCQKGGMYPTFDSAAGSGEIPVFFGIIPYLIVRVAGFDSASGPIPVNLEHWLPNQDNFRAGS